MHPTRQITDTKHAAKMAPLALILIVMSYEKNFPNFSQLTLAFPNFSLSEIFLIQIPNFFRFLKLCRSPVHNIVQICLSLFRDRVVWFGFGSVNVI